MKKKKLEIILRNGSVSGSIFAHDVDGENGRRTIRSASLPNRYKDGEEVKYVASFSFPQMSGKQ